MFLSGYARLDYRLTEEGQFYLLEANPNPQIAEGEDFADSAAHSGVPYDQLLQKIISVGLNYQAATQGAKYSCRCVRVFRGIRLRGSIQKLRVHEHANQQACRLRAWRGSLVYLVVSTDHHCPLGVAL
jgi:biotin carboxylase